MTIKSKAFFRKLFPCLLKFAILFPAALLALIPVWLVVTNSLKRSLDISVVPPAVFFRPVLTHYTKIFLQDDFTIYFRNSFVITGISTIVTIFFSALAGYGFLISKARWIGKITDILLLSKMVMPITVLIPFYLILSTLNLAGGYPGPILAHSAINIPFAIWMLLGFMRELPKELLEAGRIDGCSRMGVFWRIVFPLLSSALGAAIILAAQYSWNEYLFAVQLTRINTYTLTVAIARFVGTVAVDWGKSSAAASITMVPIIILGFVMQKYLVRGLTAGAVKG
ncbi:MAG: carbohydrate ABC transporter permease [Treponema sp.]|jgi:multiple sugar transport system permease protein|nr:carbohydrate ABC transporter permease [Treponema sp.]